MIEVEGETTIESQWIAEEGPNTLSARLVGIQPEDQNSNNDERSFDVDVGPAPDEPDFSPANIEFVGDLEEKLLVYTGAYKNGQPSRAVNRDFGVLISWENNPKKNFIIKYLFYTFTQEFWLRNTCSGRFKKNNSRCSSWLKPNCSRCGNHKFK